MRRHPAASVAVAAAIVAGGCSPAVDPTPRPAPEAELQALVDSVVAGNDAVHGAALAVTAPARGLDWAGAAGLADPAAGTAMSPSHPVRIASNTKTFVAAATLRLAESGRLDLDMPIAAGLADELTALLASDGYDPSAITVRHLLTHTGGLNDHSSPDAYTEAILADPDHRWTPAEQIRALVEWTDPIAEPGRVYSYSDSGYVLLGSILEDRTGDTLASAVRTLVGFDDLGLDSTWWEILEPAPGGVKDRAHQYLGDTDVSGFLPTFDLYGGGGLAATVGDLARFFGGLFRGAVFDEAGTVELMLTTIEGVAAPPGAGTGARPPGAYRMGVWVDSVDGLTTYAHTGFWGTAAVFVPELDLAVAATVNQHRAKPELDRLVHETIAVVRGAEPADADPRR